MKLISIEEVNVLVQYVVGVDGQYRTGRALAETDRKVCILTDEGTIATRYVVGGDFVLEYQTLEEIVKNEDQTEMVGGYVQEHKVIEWIMNEIVLGNTPFEAICYVVSVLSKHGLWERPFYKCIQENYEEFEKTNKTK